MGLQTDILAAIDSIKTSIPDVVINVIYKGSEFTAIGGTLIVPGQPLSFSETESECSLIAKSTDIETVPAWGDKISVDGVDRIISGQPKLDPVQATWKIEHVEYYSEWANIYNDQTTPDNSTVYERIKVRVLDATEGDFTQFPDGDFTQDQYIVVFRKAEYPNETLPTTGWVLDFGGDRSDLYISTVIEQSGDIKMMCREAGG